jgi:hypothetical protein
MKRKLLFLFFSTIFACMHAFCQNITANFKLVPMAISPFTITKKKQVITFLATPQVNKRTVSPSMLVSPTFYCNNLAYFCKKEIKFEKATKILFRFRLGSVQYVDYLEGKNTVVVGR